MRTKILPCCILLAALAFCNKSESPPEVANGRENKPNRVPHTTALECLEASRPSETYLRAQGFASSKRRIDGPPGSFIEIEVLSDLRSTILASQLRNISANVLAGYSNNLPFLAKCAELNIPKAACVFVTYASFSPTYVDKDHVSLYVYQNVYSAGAAHPNTDEIGYVFDRNTGKQLALGDIASDAAARIFENTFRSFVPAPLCPAYQEDLSCRLADLKTYQNFVLTECGVVVILGEVYSHADGQIYMLVRWSQLAPFLRPPFSSIVDPKAK